MRRTKRQALITSIISGLTIQLLIAPAQASSSLISQIPAKSKQTTEITIYAASSLKPAFDVIAAKFMRKHPKVKVTISYGSSGTFATAIVNGATPDIFASAAKDKMSIVKSAAATKSSLNFASNSIVLAFPQSNPHSITSVTDLNRTIDPILWARCVDSAPCGARAKASIAALGIADTPTTMVADDAAQVALLKSGEIDAALIYRSDVVAQKPLLASVKFKGAAAQTSVTKYPIAVLKTSKHKKIARQFIQFVLNKKKGQHILSKYGFGKPRG
ncbi:MAG: molybdate ABC transporter substrate-binding protein [Actinobacteria bacterium]|uniref:Unannotated protein n=1 Tax=freshwater metagenome TaxID=449393 RepID=A0A6J5ZIP7_9ZZZZ|nr:molybdate ABC transporter substrate-binding protein [Actinomycetota bacterium]